MWPTGLSALWSLRTCHRLIRYLGAAAGVWGAGFQGSRFHPSSSCATVPPVLEPPSTHTKHCFIFRLFAGMSLFSQSAKLAVVVKLGRKHTKYCKSENGIQSNFVFVLYSGPHGLNCNRNTAYGYPTRPWWMQRHNMSHLHVKTVVSTRTFCKFNLRI